MSTEDLDHRLRAAGERWRAANTAAAEVDFGELTSADEPVQVPLTPTRAQAPRRRRIRVLLAAGVGVAAAVAATIVAVSLGGSTPAHHRAIEATSTLVGVDWRLAQIAGPQGTPLAVSASLMIDDKGQLSGTDGCNHLSAPVTIGANTIKLGSVASTEMACTNPGAAFAAQVARLDAVLSGTLQWSVQGSALTLSKDGAAELGYRAAPPPTLDPTALAGVDWQLTAIAGLGPDAVVTSAGASATLRFDGRGGLEATNGCNGGGGQATITAGRVIISRLMTTLKACAALDHAQAVIVGEVLDGTVSWSIRAGVLTLSKAGAGTLVYETAPPSSATGTSSSR